MAAQERTTELWPELDIYWTRAKHERSFFEVSGSAEQEGTKREATLGAYEDYLMLPRGYLRGGFRYTFSTRDASYREERLVGEGAFTVWSWRRLRLVERTRAELRWVNAEYSYRLRERVHLQRVPASTEGRAWGPYGTFEVYYDSRYGTVSRLGARAGTEFRVFKRTGMDVYLARQDNLRGAPHIVDALGVTIKLTY